MTIRAGISGRGRRRGQDECAQRHHRRLSSRRGSLVVGATLVAALLQGCARDTDRLGDATFETRTSTSRPSEPATTTTPPLPPGPSETTSATSPASPGWGARFTTLPPGSALPSDGECGARVRPAAEARWQNDMFNMTQGHPTVPDEGYPLQARVTGGFVGTTDEILQWVACKWGIDEDVVRAQAAKESWWKQETLGDWTTNERACLPGHPIGADGRFGECPGSAGLLQVRYEYSSNGFPGASTSTAYNADYAYSVWRTCFEGGEPWLNMVDRGQEYRPGDLWGCVGRWFAGRWYTEAALEYIGAVQGYMAQRVWDTSDFLDS